MASSRLPRPRAEASAPRILDQHSTLLSALHYPPEDAAKLKTGQAWVEESETAKELVEWTREAFASALEEISVEQEERQLFDTALHHKLVKPVPSRSGPAGDDVEPSGFLFSADYRTPSELRKITEGNEESRQLLTKNNSLNAERHALLTSQLATMNKRISASQRTLAGLDPIMAVADADLNDGTQLLKSSIAQTSRRVHQGSRLILPNPTSSPQSFSSHIRTILTLSSDFTSLLSSLASLNPARSNFPPPPLDESEIESLATLFAQLEADAASPPADVADALTPLSVEELRELLEEERRELSLEEDALGVVPALRKARVQEEVDAAQREHVLAEVQRSTQGLSELKAYLERELAILISAHNALAGTLELSSEINALSTALVHVLHELSSSPSSPPLPAFSMKKEGQPERDLLRALGSLSKTPLLSRQDLETSIDTVEDTFAGRVAGDQATLAADTTSQSLLRAHLHLYSPTQVLHPTSPAVETLLGEATIREQEAKAVLSSVAARAAELSVPEKSSLKRLESRLSLSLLVVQHVSSKPTSATASQTVFCSSVRPQGKPSISPPQANEYLPLSRLDPELGEAGGEDGALDPSTSGLHLGGSRLTSTLVVLRRHAHPLLVTVAAFLLLALLLFPPGRNGRKEGWREGLTLEYPEALAGPLSVEELRESVGSDAKFLAKQSGASYGYNNVRYMLETTLLWAKLLDRVPVIPAAIWARSCALDSETCTKHSLAHFAQRNAPEHHLDVTWNEDGEIWKVAIEEFLDLPHLRATYGPVLTLEEFYTLNNLNMSLMHISGHIQHALPELVAPLTIAVASNEEFEPPHTVRIDALPVRNTEEEVQVEEELSERVRNMMGGRRVWTEEQARNAIEEAGETVGEGEDALVKAAKHAGLAPVFTFSDEVLMNKALATPSTEFAPCSSLLSFDTFSTTEPYSSSSLLFFPGAYHDQRKPGTIRFATQEARDEFARMGREGIRPPAGIRELGAVLSARMWDLSGGRKWVAAHMRRGDFINIGWSPDKDPKVHFAKMCRALSEGVAELALHFPADSLPRATDPFYLATDEEDPVALAFYRESGALLLADLMTPADAQKLGWQASFTDLLALVEQQVLAGADYFVGSAMSSTTGGVINYRIVGGKERWSWRLLGTDY